jgi:hypothetical protein
MFGSPQWPLSLRFPHQHPVHTSLLPYTRGAYLILLDFTTRTILGKEYRSFSSSLCNVLHSPVTSSLLGSNTLLNTLNLHSSLSVSDRVSHPYKTTSKNRTHVPKSNCSAHCRGSTSDNTQTDLVTRVQLLYIQGKGKQPMLPLRPFRLQDTDLRASRYAAPVRSVKAGRQNIRDFMKITVLCIRQI